MLHQLPPSKESWFTFLSKQTVKEQKMFLYNLGDAVHDFEEDWLYRLRREQFEPQGTEWDIWYLNAGRGFGKTLCGAFCVNDRVRHGLNRRIALIGPTAGDVRDVMVEGETGLIATAHPDCMPEYFPSLRKVVWPNEAEAHLYSAEEPERLRGPQHDFGWCDEIASWAKKGYKYLENTWDMYEFGLRLGNHPQTIITTTPKPLPILKEIRKDSGTVVTGGSTYENTSLPKKYYQKIIKKYEGTRLGRQEIYAEDMDQAEGALWDREMLEVTRKDDYPALKRLVVAVDPATTKSATSDDVGIVVAGLGVDGHGYILEDLSRKLSVAETSRVTVGAYKLWEADRIVAEANNGGDWIELGLRQVDKNISYKKLHASRGKQARAEPVAALYEQKRVHHVGGFPDLEDELCSWEPNSNMKSPGRLDAAVWAITELMLEGAGPTILHVRA